MNLSLAVNYQFGQLDPVGYHVFNLMVHVLSALVLMAIVHRTLLSGLFPGKISSDQRTIGIRRGAVVAAASAANRDRFFTSPSARN